MTRESDAEGGRELDPASDGFDAIVSAWRREGQVPEWPDDEDGLADGEGGRGPAAPLFVPPTPTAPVSAQPEEEGHFVPPEPPPLPRLGPPAIVGLVLLGLGLTLVLAPGWLGVPSTYGLPLGLFGLAAGLGWLVLRLWPDPAPPDGGDGQDDGAVI